MSVFFLLFISIFDPADKLLGFKELAFIWCWLVFLFYYYQNPGIKVRLGVYIYILLMIAIPVISMAYFELFLGGGNSAALILIKSHLYSSFILILVVARLDIIPMLSRILSLLAVCIIGVKVLVIMFPPLLTQTQLLGELYGIFLLGDRTYDGSAPFQQIYFVTSPMLLIAIAYYLNKACNENFFSKDLLLAVLNIFAITIAGTRSNMISPIIVAIWIGFIYVKNKLLYVILLTVAFLLIALVFLDDIMKVFSLQESSNSVKLDLIKDYLAIFSDPVYLFFGQGFGAFHYWEAKGMSGFITELSYLELIRIYGLFFGLIMAGLILYPIIYTIFSNRKFPSRNTIAGFTLYMAIAALNPLIFSSLGITIISAYMANIFRSRDLDLEYIRGSHNKNYGSG